MTKYPKNWNLIFSVRADKILGTVIASTRIMYTVLISAIVLGILFTWLMSTLISRPMRRLTRVMQDITQTSSINTRVNMDEYYPRETAVLAAKFNSMMSRIRKLVKDISEERGMVREMEQRVLQNQINAHFLRNSLQVLGLQALDANADKVYASICDLSYLVSENMQSGEPLATIRQEKEYVNHYIAILRQKYEDKIAFNVDIDDDTLEYCLPKLILQPLVENAVKHGVAMCIGKGSVDISVKKAGKHLIIRVQDDGNGISAQDLEKLLQDIRSEEIIRSEHIGLRNLYRRLKILYGDNMDFDLEGELYHGLKAIITLECLTMEEGKERLRV